jgi:hypothetical protein
VPSIAATLAPGNPQHVMVHLPQVLNTSPVTRHYYGVTLDGTKQLTLQLRRLRPVPGTTMADDPMADGRWPVTR